MKQTDMRQLARLFREQYSVATRKQLRLLGITDSVERNRIAAGEWERVSPKVVRLAGSRPTPEQMLMAAVLSAGPAGFVSHQSAAWLWGLARPPARHSVTVPYGATAGRGHYDLHRLKGDPPELSLKQGFAATNPLRTLVDLAGVVAPSDLDTTLDRAIAARLVTVEAVKAETSRLSEHGRKGTGAMRRSLSRRGLIEGPHPSVLESRLHRLFASVGIRPVATEVVAGPQGEYRIDVMLSETVAVEVDGHAYHSTPEQKQYDERRRTQLRLGGMFVLVYTWRDITGDGRRVAAECRTALARAGSVPRQRLAN
jgi:hypothetical protein